MKTHWRMIMTVCITAAMSPAAQAAPDIGGPSLGYLYDSDARTLTAVLGIAGTSVRGTALAVPSNITSLRMAPGQNYGVAVLEDGAVALAEVTDSSLTVRKFKNAMTNPDEVVFGPSGRTVLLYSKADGRLQTILNVADAAYGVRETSAADATTLAVSDDGAWTVFANSTGLWTVDASGTVRRVAAESGVCATAFRPNSNDLVFATPTALYGISITAVSGDATLLKDELDSILAVAESSDGAFVFARTGSGVTVVRSEDGFSTAVMCDCEVTSFEALNGRNVFRLSDGGSGPTYVFDGGGTEPRIVFIPGQAPVEDKSTEGGAQ